MKKSKKHDRVVKEAYCLLVSFRNIIEDEGDSDYAERIEEAYKQLWCECLNEPAPWL